MVARPAPSPLRALPLRRGGRARRSARAGTVVALVFSSSLLCALALVAAAPSDAAEELVEGVAAQVGTDIVLASEVFELSAPVEERMRQAGAPRDQILAVRRDALERLIEGRLLSSVVSRLELDADRDEVDAAISAIAEENGLSMEQLLSSVTSHGLTVQEYRDKIKGEIERSKVVNAMVRSRVQIEAEEVEALYRQRFGEQPEGGDEVHLRHIVVMPGGRTATTPAQACDRVSAARTEIVGGGADFGAVARELSDMNPEQAGDLGWIHRRDVADWMAQVVDGLAPGELSSVIEMPFGCNLIQLVDRRGFERITYEQAEPQLQNYLYQQKMEEEYTKWLDVLRQQTFIERKGAFGG